MTEFASILASSITQRNLSVLSSVRERPLYDEACPQCGAPWDSEHNRCTAQCDQFERDDFGGVDDGMGNITSDADPGL